MKNYSLKLKVWRQKDSGSKGELVDYSLSDVNPDMSFLEVLDLLNEKLVAKNKRPISFDHDCREGICGTCSMNINGNPHGPVKGVTACQLHMRHFKDGDTIVVEPFRAKPFRILSDLVVDRSSMDRVIQSGGYISVSTGQAPEANSIPVQKEKAEEAMDFAACIGCGACVAACKNASAMLFVGAKVSHLNSLPQGKIEKNRVLKMVEQMDKEGFGNCSSTKACEATCPKEISVKAISELNKLFLKSQIR